MGINFSLQNILDQIHSLLWLHWISGAPAEPGRFPAEKGGGPLQAGHSTDPSQGRAHTWSGGVKNSSRLGELLVSVTEKMYPFVLLINETSHPCVQTGP